MLIPRAHRWCISSAASVSAPNAMSIRTAKNNIVPIRNKKTTDTCESFPTHRSHLAVRIYLTSRADTTPRPEKHWETVHLDDKRGQVPIQRFRFRDAPRLSILRSPRCLAHPVNGVPVSIDVHRDYVALAIQHNHFVSCESHSAQSAAIKPPLKCEICDINIVEGVFVLRILIEIFNSRLVFQSRA